MDGSLQGGILGPQIPSPKPNLGPQRGQIACGMRERERKRARERERERERDGERQRETERDYINDI